MTGLIEMKNRKLMLTGIAAIVIATACNTKKQNEVPEKHAVQIEKEGAGMIYVDKISCSSVIQSTDSAGSDTGFRCFRVGFIDSLAAAKAADKKSLATGKYYQYDMQKDWTILVNGDSVKPVFYQPRQRIENHRYEGILVFEIPKDKRADTLIYGDSYGAWGTQQIIINSNKK
jgi:hypothetical protein